MAVVKSIERLGFPFKTPDPFLFAVYHLDNYPAGDAKMQAPKRGNGADFDPSQPYRMYHGGRIPGFPQHPHRGFETITVTMEGIIDHCDSMGNGGRYGNGDNQWMTAGRGIVHGEMFPLVHGDKPNRLKLFQIWLNLPSRNKMVEPHFVMHWGELIPKVSGEGGSQATVYAGRLGDATGLRPPPASWASDSDNEVMVLHLVLPPQSSFRLPAARGGAEVNRVVYHFAGPDLDISGTKVAGQSAATLDAGAEAVLHNPAAPPAAGVCAAPAELLLLQGKPIGEPVVQHGPFVMNTRQEIAQAFSDYQRDSFGGWPWPSDDHVFPRDKPRFALTGGREILAPEPVL